MAKPTLTSMNQTGNSSPASANGPERVILSRRRHLNDVSVVSGFFKKLLILVFFITVLFTAFFGLKPMVGNDMKPSFKSGDLLLYYRGGKEYHVGDLVVYSAEGKKYVGRIAASGGDTISITEAGTVEVNGNTVISENDFLSKTPRYGDEVSYPVLLGNDEFFVLADYRDGGKDSRYFGAVPLAEVKGKIITALRRSQL